MKLLATLFLLPSALLAANGDIGWVSIETNGWVAQVMVTGLSTGGTYAYGLGASNLLTGNEKLTISLSSQGFDDNGTAANIGRTIYGVFRLRQPYPTQTSAYEIVSGSDVILRIALSDYVFAGDTLSNAVVRVGLYVQGGTTNNAATLTTVTNASNIAYPRVLAMWSDVPHQLAGSNETLRCVAFHYSATNARPVRLVKFFAKDSMGNVTATNTVLNPTIDTSYGDPVPVIEYVTTLNLGTLAQGSKVSNYFVAFPWYGPALDCSDGTKSDMSPDYGPFISWCDKSNLWPSVYAIVDPANGTTSGKAVTTLTQATNGTAIPYATIAQAINAVGGTNNAVNGSNTFENCFVLLTNGNYNWVGGETLTNRNTPATWLTIQARPDVSYTNVLINSNTVSGTGQKDAKLKFLNVNFSWTNNVSLVNQGYGWAWVDRCIVLTNLSSTALVVKSFTNAWMTRSEIYRNVGGFKNAATEINSCFRLRGNTWYGGGNPSMASPLLIGNLGSFPQPEQLLFKNDQVAAAPNDPAIYAFNKMLNLDGAVYTFSLGIGTNINQGAAVIQNLLEVGKQGNAVTFDVIDSQHEHEYCTNFLCWNNTDTAVYHPPFELGGFTDRTETVYQDLNNIFYDLDFKCDAQDHSANETNRWNYLYHVGSFGNASAEQTTGQSSFILDSTVNLGFNGLSYGYYGPSDSSAFLFLTNAGAYGGNSNGFGDYHLQSSSPVRGLPTRQVLPYDLAGNPRSANDPPGAYADIPAAQRTIFQASGSLNFRGNMRIGP